MALSKNELQVLALARARATNQVRLVVDVDDVARRIVIRREQWERCVAMAGTLKAQGLDVLPCDVLAAAAEVGLS